MDKIQVLFKKDMYNLIERNSELDWYWQFAAGLISSEVLFTPKSSFQNSSIVMKLESSIISPEPMIIKDEISMLNVLI